VNRARSGVDERPPRGSTMASLEGTHIRLAGRSKFGIGSVARRGFCAALLVFQFVFLNVIIPGHRRGAIPLSGAASVNSIADFGCSLCSQLPAPPPAPGKAPKPGLPQFCAICAVAAHLMVPSAFELLLPALGLLMCLAVLAPARFETPRLIPTYFGRAPPLSRV